MMISMNRVEDFAEQLDRTLNHNYTRKRVEDQLGLQRVNWDFYKQSEANGMVLLLTAMHEDELVGFALYFVYVHPHHPEAKLGQCQFLIVVPKFRGQHLGRLLVEHAMPELKRRGCSHIIHNRRMAYDVVPLFTKIGFEKLEESYVKEL
jgi:GNAT superfamily N-acetyltransferase